MTSVRQGGEFVHPELRSGEVLLRNMNSAEIALLPLSTKRLGQTAFDGEGRELTFKDWTPVFVQEAELKQCGLSLADARRKFNHLQAAA